VGVIKNCEQAGDERGKKIRLEQNTDQADKMTPLTSKYHTGHHETDVYTNK